MTADRGVALPAGCLGGLAAPQQALKRQRAKAKQARPDLRFTVPRLLSMEPPITRLRGLISTTGASGMWFAALAAAAAVLQCSPLQHRKLSSCAASGGLIRRCAPLQARSPKMRRTASAEVPVKPHPLQLLGSRGGNDSGLASLAPSPSPPLPPPLAPSHAAADRLAAIAPALATLTTELADVPVAALHPPWR
jgi:hypothetical protein